MSIWALTLERQASRREAVLSYALLYTSRREVVWEICSKQLVTLIIPLRSHERKRAIVRGGGLCSFRRIKRTFEPICHAVCSLTGTDPIRVNRYLVKRHFLIGMQYQVS